MPRPTRTGTRGLYRDAEGRYRIDLRYNAPDGSPARYRERIPPGTPARAAELRARDVLAAALTGALAPRGEAAPEQLGAALAEYQRLHTTGNPAQRARHCRTLLAIIGDGPLCEVGDLAIAKFKRDRAAQVAPSTVNRELQTLRHFLGCAVDWHWIDARPKVRLLKEPPGRVRWLTEDERARLDAALPARLRRVAMVAALSGQRLGNVIGLTRDRVDFAARVLSIPKTKSGKRHDVPISAALASVLREAIADGDALAARHELEPPTHVLLSRLGAPYTSSGVTSLFRRAVARAGIRDFHFHDLRHDFATRLRRAGHGLDVVQELLGHATPAMTQRYAHIGADELHRAVEAAGAIVAPALPPGSPKRPRKTGKKAR